MSMTVTADATASKLANGINLRVKVLTNVAAIQDGAAGNTSSAEHLSITTTEIGSRIYGAALNSSSSGFAVNASTTAIDNVTDATNGGRYATCKSAADTASLGAANIGYTNTRTIGGISLFEVKSDGVNVIAEDASSPALTTVTTSAAATTAAFTPPIGSLLVALVSGMFNLAPAMSDSMGLNWVLASSLASGSGGQAVVYIARVPDSGTGSIGMHKMGLSGSGSIEDTGSAGLVLTNTFEGGTNNATLTQGSGGNTGGTSGSYFDTVSIDSGAAIVFSNSHPQRNPKGVKFTTDATGETAYIGWNAQLGGGTVGKLWFRIYIYLTAFPSSELVVAEFDDASGTRCARLQIETDGTLSFHAASGSGNQIATTASIGTGHWIRVEGFVTGSATVGQLEMKLFNTADSLTPTETQTSATTFNTQGPIAAVKYGVIVLAVPSLTLFLDDLGLSDSAYMGPTILTGSGGVNLKKMSLSSAGSEKDAGTGSIALKKMSLSGTGTEPGSVSGTGSVDIHKMSLAGTSMQINAGSGGVILHKLGLSAAGTETVAAIGGITLKKMSLSGSGIELQKVSGTGGVILKKMKLTGIGSESATASAGVSLVNTFEGGADGLDLTQGADGNTGGGGSGSTGLAGHTAQQKGYNLNVQDLTGTNPNFTRLQTANYADGVDVTAGGHSYPSKVSGLDGSPALTVQKWFVGDDNYYTTQSAIPNDLTDLIDKGTKIVFCIKPGSSASPPQKSVADRHNLASTIYSLKTYAASKGAPEPICVLNSEANGNGSFDVSGAGKANPGQASANAFISWYNYYAQVVENPTAYVTTIPADSGLAVGYDVATNHGTGGNYQQFYPGDQHVWFVGADAYGNLLINSDPWYLDQPNGMATVSITDLADNNTVHGPVPFWVFEWGADQQGVASPLTVAQWQTWHQYIGNLFAGRKIAGKPNGGAVWYSGTNYPEWNLLPGTQSGGIGYSLIAGLNYVRNSLLGGSGSYFDNIHRGAGSTIKFSNDHPARTPLAVKITTDATGEIAWFAWSDQLQGTLDEGFFRAYLFLPALPASTLAFVEFLDANGVQCARIQVTSAGILQFNDGASGSGQIVGVVPVRVGHWIRIEGRVIGSPTAGQIEFKQYNTADSLIADDVQTSAATFNTTGPIAKIQYGISSLSVASATLYMDDVGLSNSDYMGPTILTGDEGTGGVALKKMSLSGAGTARHYGTGGVAMKKMALTGSVVEKAIGHGGVSLSKMTIHAIRLGPVAVRFNGEWLNAVVKARVGGVWVPAVPKVMINGVWVAVS
jgi:hypothetical protein